MIPSTSKVTSDAGTILSGKVGVEDNVDSAEYSRSPNTRMSAKMVAELTTRIVS